MRPVRGEDLARVLQAVPRRGIGLGDLVQVAANAVGIKPCGGCKKRKESLNRFQVRW